MTGISGNEKRGYVFARLRVIIPPMLVILAVLMIISMAVGASYVPFFQTVKIILSKWGIIGNAQFASGQEAIIYSVRFPRVLTAVVIGAALAASGTVMQGMFRNPMADPGILGVSNGAGLGAVTAIALGLSTKSLFITPLFASAGALAAASVVFILSSRKGRFQPLTLILSGVAVGMFIGSVTSILLSKISSHQVKTYLFWTMGSLSYRSWEHLLMSALPICVLLIILLTFSRDLNIMLLGEEEAQSVGLNPARTRKILMLLTSLTTAIAVSVSGSISFVGLIVPHIMRLIVGPDHRILLPVSMLGGAIYLVACDTLARIVLMPEEIGVGIITSLLGAPYFLYLLVRSRKAGDML